MFWHYENEFRAFIEIEQNPLQIAVQEPSAFRDDPFVKIQHHRPDEISGVIFGPKFDIKMKEKIEATLRQNINATDKGNFFLFDTTLTGAGEVEISTARECISGSMDFTSRIITGASRDGLLDALGIKHG